MLILLGVSAAAIKVLFLYKGPSSSTNFSHHQLDQQHNQHSNQHSQQSTTSQSFNSFSNNSINNSNPQFIPQLNPHFNQQIHCNFLITTPLPPRFFDIQQGHQILIIQPHVCSLDQSFSTPFCKQTDATNCLCDMCTNQGIVLA